MLVGIVVLALFACKKKDEEALPDAEVPDVGAPVEAEAPPPPVDTAAIDAAAPVPTQPVYVHRDAGAATDAAAPRDGGTAAADAAAPAADAGSRTADLQACARACETQLRSCLARVAEGGSNAQCAAEVTACSAACRRR